MMHSESFASPIRGEQLPHGRGEAPSSQTLAAVDNLRTRVDRLVPLAIPPWRCGSALLVVALGAPMMFTSTSTLTLLCVMCITMVLALSYNILLGQCGLLSFGHAVYYAMGAFFTAHAMNWLSGSEAALPLPLLPLVGGIAGLLFGVVFGLVSVRHGGLTFAMISVGIAEFVHASTVILKSAFGGEEGISTDRTALHPFLGLSFGSQVQVYYLLAAWCLLCIAAMYFLSRTPLGRAFVMVRDNPERMRFMGCSVVRVRFLAFCFATFFAGVAGGMAAINFEMASASYLQQSFVALLAAYVGGTGYFLGPVLGAVIVPLLQLSLSDYSPIWQFYFGVFFLVLVLYAPGGLFGLLEKHRRLRLGPELWQLIPIYAGWLVSLAVAMLGAVLLSELTRHFCSTGPAHEMMRWLGIAISAMHWAPWLAGVLLTGAGIICLRRASPALIEAWERASTAHAGGTAP